MSDDEPNMESLRSIAETDAMIVSGDYPLYDDAATLLASASAEAKDTDSLLICRACM